MKWSLKHYKKYLSTHHYIVILRRQPAHIQHMYAALFAGTITMLFAVIILYFDYGFWHEKYSRNEIGIEVYSATSTDNDTVIVSSPSDMIGNFVKEARDKLHGISNGKADILEGKDTYIREEKDIQGVNK